MATQGFWAHLYISAPEQHKILVYMSSPTLFISKGTNISGMEKDAEWSDKILPLGMGESGQWFLTYLSTDSFQSCTLCLNETFMLK